MNGPAAARGAVAAPIIRPADRSISRAAAATVVGLAGIAGAISYSHMRQLAAAHGDAGWHAHAFPLSVDGVEIVASLVLLSDRRAVRRSGWLPWSALVIGTAASLAANVATAGAGTVSQIIVGWPALALLIAVKLLSGILEHRPAAAVPPLAAGASRDGCSDEVSSLHGQTVPAPSGLVSTPGYARLGESGRPRARDSAANRPAPASTASRQAGSPRRTAATAAGAAWMGTALSAHAGPVPGTAPDIAALLPAARAARDELRRDGHPLTRDSLAACLRRHGHPVRNARLTPLLQALRGESAGQPLNGQL